MRRSFIQFCLAIRAVLAALGLTLLLPAAAAAQPLQSSPCFVNQVFESEAALERAYKSQSRWDCSKQKEERAGGDWSLRFDVAQSPIVPQVLNTRLGYFERLRIAVRNDKGKWSIEGFGLEDAKSTFGEPMIEFPVPQVSGKPVAVIASFTGNGHGSTLSRAMLLDKPQGLSESTLIQFMSLAALIGMMLVPIALDAIFYRAQRRSFLAWHIVLTLSFAGMIVTRSGIINLIAEVPPDIWRVMLIMATGVMAATALMFLRSYIEPDRLSRRLRAAIPIVAIWTILLSAVHAASLEVLRPLGGNFHSLGMIPAFAVILALMVDACRKRSRAVIFVLIGWAPILLASFIQISTQILPFALQNDALPLFYIGILSEGIATAMGVADRFFALRRERDDAISEAKELGRLSERDGLTGLYNRRTLEGRFDDLRQQGFDTMALLDLDRFKQINDRFGHRTGDAVLVACAKVFNSGRRRDSIAARLGGEEFMILTRGRRGLQLAEKFRQAIPVRVAAEVEGLDCPVTASMGVISIPSEGLQGMDFAELYARADTLLYEAKKAGRNRTVHERIMRFDTPESARSVEAA
ncbi:sensor domain-containing diguanylate cyclase [Altererythrobacter sp.]